MINNIGLEKRAKQSLVENKLQFPVFEVGNVSLCSLER